MLLKRGNAYSLRLRVPAKFRSIDSRKFVTISLKTSDPVEAQRRHDIAADQMLAGWEAQLSGDGISAEERFNRAKQTAQRLGFSYVQNSELADLHVSELLSRIAIAHGASERLEVATQAEQADRAQQAATGATEVPSAGRYATHAHIARSELDSALGLADSPQVLLSGAVEEDKRIQADKLASKDESQLKRWTDERARGLEDLIAVVGEDKPVESLTRKDLADLRQEYIRRAQLEKGAEGHISWATASRYLTIVLACVRSVAKEYGFKLDLADITITIPRGKKAQRVPYPEDFLRDKVLAEGALDRMNDQARWVLLIMVNTGARPSELEHVRCKNVCLDGNIPFIRIFPEDRELKTANSERQIPLS